MLYWSAHLPVGRSEGWSFAAPSVLFVEKSTQQMIWKRYYERSLQKHLPVVLVFVSSLAMTALHVCSCSSFFSCRYCCFYSGQRPGIRHKDWASRFTDRGRAFPLTLPVYIPYSTCSVRARSCSLVLYFLLGQGQCNMRWLNTKFRVLQYDYVLIKASLAPTNPCNDVFGNDNA